MLNEGATRHRFSFAFGYLSIALFCALMGEKLLLIPLREALRGLYRVDEVGAAKLWALAFMGLVVRPFIGIAVDALTGKGASITWLILAASLGSGAAWVGASLVWPGLRGTIAMLALANVGCVIAEVGIGAIFVDRARAGGATSRLSAIRVVAQSAVVLISGPLGGYLASRPLKGVTMVATVFMVLLSAMIMQIGGKPQAPLEGGAPHRRLMTWGVLMPALLGFIFYAVPGFSNVLYYRQIEVHGMTPFQSGLLDAANNLASFAALPIFIALRRRVSLKRILPWCIFLYALSSAGYALYGPGIAALAVELTNGLLSTLGLLAIQESCLKAAQEHGGAAALSLILAASGLGIASSEVIGSSLYLAMHRSFSAIVGLNVAGYLVLAALTRIVRDRLRWLSDKDRPGDERSATNIDNAPSGNRPTTTSPR